jgi:hypothetical protein
MSKFRKICYVLLHWNFTRNYGAETNTCYTSETEMPDTFYLETIKFRNSRLISILGSWVT